MRWRPTPEAECNERVAGLEFELSSLRENFKKQPEIANLLERKASVEEALVGAKDDLPKSKTPVDQLAAKSNRATIVEAKRRREVGATPHP